MNKETAFIRVVSIIVIAAFVAALFGCAPRRELSIHERASRAVKVDELLSRAVRLMRQGDAQSLRAAYSALLLAEELSPKDARIADGFGCIAWRQKNWSAAEQHFKDSRKFNPEYDRAYAHLALVAEKRGDLEEAFKLYQTALSLNPLNYRARNNYAAALFDSGRSKEQKEQAVKELRKAVQGSPKVDEVLGRNLRIMDVSDPILMPH